MKFVRIAATVCMVLMLAIGPAGADEISELKAMVQQLKSDYESRIQGLEAKIQQLEAGQEQKVTDKVTQLREEIKQEIKDETLQVDYVGRHNAPVGDGGLLVKNPFGFGNVSLGGYFDMEYLDRENEDATFRQHRWIINIGAQPHDRVRFNSELEIEYGGPNVPSSDGEIKVEQAYGDYLINDMINLRAGAILSPFGRYNLLGLSG